MEPTSRKKLEKLNVVHSSREWCNVEVLRPMGWVSEAATEETPSEEEQHLSICLTEAPAAGNSSISQRRAALPCLLTSKTVS